MASCKSSRIHFHTYYVIGFIEDGQRRLICQNQEYIIEKGDILLSIRMIITHVNKLITGHSIIAA
ncbi:hypothetical protein BSAF29S_05059 [Bacillus safensis subsp. safensis]